MGKRSDYEKLPRDYYPTPEKAVEPLLRVLPNGITFYEPCVGDGRLVDHLMKGSDRVCMGASDIEPLVPWASVKDGTKITEDDVELSEYIITNPPYTWKVLKGLIDHWLTLDKTIILLLPADYMHNIRFSPYMEHCSLVVSIGRVKWIEGSKTGGVDNYAWYIFSPDKVETVFIPRFKGE